jgi:hypothetical protein
MGRVCVARLLAGLVCSKMLLQLMHGVALKLNMRRIQQHFSRVTTHGPDKLLLVPEAYVIIMLFELEPSVLCPSCRNHPAFPHNTEGKQNKPYFIIALLMGCGSIGLSIVTLVTEGWHAKLAYVHVSNI